MSFQIHSQELRRIALFAIGASGLSSVAGAQVTFSVDWHSPTVGMPDSFTAIPITEGDILMPVTGMPSLGPLPMPGTVISAGPTGLGLAGWAPCVGHPGGTPCMVEVDALSYGVDFPLQNSGNITGDYLFSTDEFAMGLVGPPIFPGLISEAPVGDSSSDVWRNAGFLPPGPLPPFAAPVGHIGVIDGDGLPSGSGAIYPGTGLIEPNFPGFPNIGDNLDALDTGTPFSTSFPPTGVYFSLDEPFFDVLSGVPNSGSAPAHGFTGADILWTPAPGAPPLVWAPGAMLGLNMAGGLDDLDALAIWENGTGAFEPSVFPYDWAAGGSDMVLFSVRRGSPVIGAPDSIFGIPIMEGDILTTPLPTFMGGVSPFPGMFCAAENIGLGTFRSSNVNDDLNALDTVKDPFFDCNGNGTEDALDIAMGTSTDINLNGVPDECEIIGGPYCYCPAGSAPCGNPDASAGCANSTGVGALLSATGSGSVFADDLVLTATSLPPGKIGLFFAGTAAIGPFPFGDGLRCAGGTLKRFPPPAAASATGVLTKGPGIAGSFGILPFATWNFQCWYRDPAGPCGAGWNTSNAFSVFFTP